jgi:hypothetical protein
LRPLRSGGKKLVARGDCLEQKKRTVRTIANVLGVDLGYRTQVPFDQLGNDRLASPIANCIRDHERYEREHKKQDKEPSA